MKAKIYSHLEDKKAIAFLDILGFSELTKTTGAEFETAYWSFVNAIERYRESMGQVYKGVPRDVPIDATLHAIKAGFWYANHVEGSVGFQYTSDCLVLYSTSTEHLINALSSIVGAAIVWGVPVRGGISIGSIFHSEYLDRPGIATPLYGPGFTRAAELEKAQRNAAFRIFLDDSVRDLLLGNNSLKHWLDLSGACQLKWWLGAFNDGDSRKESALLEQHWGEWKTKKGVRSWFADPHKADAEIVVKRAVEELKSLNR